MWLDRNVAQNSTMCVCCGLILSLVSNFIFLCFKFIIIHYHTQTHRKITFEPRITLSTTCTPWSSRYACVSILILFCMAKVKWINTKSFQWPGHSDPFIVLIPNSVAHGHFDFICCLFDVVGFVLLNYPAYINRGRKSYLYISFPA